MALVGHACGLQADAPADAMDDSLAARSCGNGACSAKETCTSCPQDCGVCPAPEVCGDATCQASETCSSCPQDCGTCTSPAPTYTGPRFGTAPTIDGGLGEYASLPAITLSGASGTADVRAGWDAQALYLAFDVTDSALLPASGAESALWNGDGVEVMIDAAFDRSTTADQNDFHFVVSSSGQLADAVAWTDYSFASGATANATSRAGGYRVELRIPFAQLGVTPAAGMQLGFDVAFNDRDVVGGPLSSKDFAGLTAFNAPSRWGVLVLGSTVVTPPMTCGDAVCSADEDCTTCAQDCGVCPPTDLCAGLVTDKLAHPMTSLAKPAVGAAVTDPQFGTTIRRITGAAASRYIVPVYSTIQAWNADETYLILYGNGGFGHHLYDGKTYAHLRALSIASSNSFFYWHPTDPDVLFFIDSTNTLVRYHVGAGTKEPLRTFACSGVVSGGDDPMYLSWDGNVIGLHCSTGTAFTYRIDTNTVVGSTSSSRGPQVSASGTLVFLYGEVRSVGMSLLRTLGIAYPGAHASLGRLANGRDTWNGVQYNASATVPVASLITCDMTDASCRVIIGQQNGYPYPPSGIHVSALAHKRPGWVVIGATGNATGQTVLDNELVLADTNAGGKVCRIAHHRSYGHLNPITSPNLAYWAQPHAVISPTGTRVLFGSDWGGGNSVDSYVVELPSYQP